MVKIKKVNGVGIIFESLDGKILTLLRSNNKTKEEECGSWGLVGGKIEDGEQPSDAAIRETKEEINYNLNSSNLEYLSEFIWDRKNMSITFHTFKVIVDKEFKPDLQGNEHICHEWSNPKSCYQKNNLMLGLYDIIKRHYNLD